MALHEKLAQILLEHPEDGALLSRDFDAFLKSVSDSFDRYEKNLQLSRLAASECADELSALNEKLLHESIGLEYANTELGRVLNQVEEGFFTRDLLANQYIHMSIGCERIYGYTVDEFYANTLLWYQVIHPDDLHLVEQVNELLNNGQQVKSSYRIYHKDQSVRWIEVKAIPVFKDGKLCRVDGIVSDITDQKNAEKLLRESEVKYRSFFENSMDGILLSDAGGRLLTANPAACEIFGFTEKEICSLSRAALMKDDSVAQRLEEDKVKEKKTKAEFNLQRKDGSRFYAEVTTVGFSDANDQQLTSIIIRDITVQKISALALLMNERQLNLIYNTVSDSIFMLSVENETEFKFVSVNQSFLTATGLVAAQVEGKLVQDVIPEPSLQLVLEKYKACTSEKRNITWEERTGYPSGIKTGIVSINPSLDDKGHVSMIIGSVHDITERKRVEEEIKKSEQNFQSLVNSIEGIVWEADATTFRFSFVSKRAETLLGYPVSDWIGNDDFWVNHIHPEDRAWAVNYCKQCTIEKKSHEFEYRMIAADGTIVWLHDLVSVIHNEDFSFYLRGIMVDITPRKKAEQAIKDSEEKYHTVVEQASDSIFIYTPGGPFMDVNQSGCDLLGYSKEEFSGMHLADVMLEVELEHKFLIQQGLLQGEKNSIERNFLHKNGSSIPVDITAKLLSDGRIIAIVRNITERRLAEKNIRESIERFQRLSKATHDAIWDWNLDTDEIWWNESFYKIMGYATHLPVPGINEWSSKLHPDDRDKVVKRLRSVRRNTLDFWEDEFRYQNGANKYGTVLERAYVLRDEQGKPIRVIGAIMDITGRKETEQEIAASERRYRLIVETAQEGIWLMDENYVCIFVNKKMCDLFEYTAEEMIGRSPRFFMDDKDKPDAMLLMERGLRGEAGNQDIPFVTKSGKYIWTNLSTSTIVDHQQKSLGALAMVTDITNRKLDEQRIKRSQADLDTKNKELKRKNAELEQFAYVASHDLQEPLRTISSFVKLLNKQYEGRLDARADKYLQFILDSSDRMKILINDLLDYSRIGDKHEMVMVDCNQILADVLADIEAAINDAGAIIHADQLPVINGYTTEIKQLFQNLLINAIKFRKKDTAPQLSITARQSGGQWLFAFADNGIGIDKAYKERIFVIFQRLHTRSEYMGSGIGLSHCKKIVELHNGKIWVESEPGMGSIFYFTIPFNESW